MADASLTPNPSGWSDAFAALPLEAPPTSRWPAIAAQLDVQPATRPTPGRTRTWLALAASLFALALLPLAWKPHHSNKDPIVAVATPATVATAPEKGATESHIDPVIDNNTATRSDRSDRPSAAVATDTTLASTTGAQHAKPRVGRRQVASRHSTVSTESAANTGITAGTASDETLEALYAASAQLETLLLLTRDTRAESAPAAALAGDFDAALATIDAQLAQSGLPVDQQQALWRARVDTLQQATRFEANQRWLSAQGRRYEGALVRVD